MLSFVPSERPQCSPQPPPCLLLLPPLPAGREGPSAGLEHELLPTLIHFTIKTYFPAIWAEHRGDDLLPRSTAAAAGSSTDGTGSTAVYNMYLDWFKEVRSGTGLAHWC